MGKDMRKQIGRQFDQIVTERTNASLQEKNRVFPLEHREDTDEELLVYLRQCVERIGRSPRMDEVIGGSYLTERFGGWIYALHAAGFSPPTKGPKPNGRRIFKEEYKIQHKLFREERAARIRAKSEQHSAQAG